MSRKKPRPRREAPLRSAVEAHQPEVPRSRFRRLLTRFGPGAAMLLMLAAGFAVRVIPAMPFVYPSPGEVRLFDPDSYYHVRHARFAAEHAFHLQRWDPSVYPSGSAAYYAGLFDLTTAAVALAVGGGHADRDLVERVAPWVPAVLGTLCILVIYLVGRAASGRAAGLCAALFLLVFPGTFLDRSLLGFVDHHVVEVLVALLTVLGLTRCLQAAHGPAPPSWKRPALLHALPMSLFLFSWYGAPIYFVLISVTLFLVGSLEILRNGQASALATATLRYIAGILLVVIPIPLLFPWLAMERSMLIRTIIAMALMALALPAYFRLAAWLVARRVPRIVVVGAAVAAGIAAILLAIRFAPRAQVLVDQLIGVKTGMVQEQSDVDFMRWWTRNGPISLLAAATLPLALADAWRKKDFVSRMPAVLIGTLVVGLWYRTHDYDYAAGAFTPLLAALTVAVGLGFLPRRGRWRPAAGVVVLLGIVAPFWPLDKAQFRWPNQRRLDNAMHLEEGVLHALRWVRDHAPPLAVPLHTMLPVRWDFRHPKGNYGVMSFWDLGHYVAAIAERPAVAIGALSVTTARWFLLTDEEDSIRSLAEGLEPGEDLKYCVVDARTAGDIFGTLVRMVGRSEKEFAEPFGNGELPGGRKLPLYTFGSKYKRSMLARLFLDADDLAHYRLVYASPEKHAIAYVSSEVGSGTNVTRRVFSLEDPAVALSWQRMARQGGITRQGLTFIYDIAITSTAKVYEKVLGARITGNAPPGAKVEARLRLKARALGGQEIAYHREGVADAAGGFTLVVPYPTGEQKDDTDVVAYSPYEIVVDGQPAGRVQVSVQQVRQGAVVPAQGR